jgi:6-pyruvoyl-tetrahydropterin synthase
MNTRIPRQTIPFYEKNDEWKRNTVEAYIQQANFSISASRYKQQLLKLYDYYNGDIDELDYSYVLEPYGKKRSNFPARIRNYNIIKPNIDLLIGEKAKRPFNFSIILHDPDIMNVKLEEKNKVIQENIYQWFINKLNEGGMDTGMESQEVELPEYIAEQFERTWKDNRVKIAEAAMRYLIPYLNYKEKMDRGWFDFLVSGWVYTHRYVQNNEPFFEVINPIDVDYDKDPELDFVEDGEWVVIRKLAKRSSIVDAFYKELTQEQIEQLESPRNSNKEGAFYHNPQQDNVFNDHDNYAEWITVYWKSLTRVGIFTYIDEFGDIVEEVINEADYDERIHGDLEWVWVNEVWKGTRIDGDIYLDINPLEVQRGSIDNPSKCKLPVNGRAYSNRNSTNISLVLLGIPFQLTYNIFKFRLENAIAKSKDLLAIFDINMIPEGWDMDKWMNMVDSTGIAWQDYAKEGIQLNPQHKAAIDMSIKTVEQYLALLQSIIEEWERLSGITRQRQGQTGTYEGKGVTEQSIIQSSHITEDYFRKFNQLEQRDIQAILDYAQLAWINGKKAMYALPDGSTEYFETDEAFNMAEFGIFISDSSQDLQKIGMLQQLTQAAIQNGTPLSVVAEIINSDNFTTILDKIKKAEASMQEMQEMAQEAQQQALQQQMEMEAAKMEAESIEKEKDRQNKIEIELIKQSQQNVEPSTTDLDGRKQELAERKLQLEQQLKQRQLAEQERSNRANETLKNKQIQVAAKRKTSQ